jgi:hypothetical protein
MDKNLQLAIDTIFDALTTTWEDNGNTMCCIGARCSVLSGTFNT